MDVDVGVLEHVSLVEPHPSERCGSMILKSRGEDLDDSLLADGARRLCADDSWARGDAVGLGLGG